MKLTADFTNIIGKIKPMHGVGQPPMTGLSDLCMHYVGEAGFPYSRLHDAGGAFGGSRYVDIPNVFPDFDADENDPASYDFTFTDWLMTAIKKQGCEPFYRLGVTIENYYHVKSYRTFPPKDFEKWARICEHVVRHYNEGWADGFHYDIKYWEIWNEPEGEACWSGTREEFFRLYEVASNHLKKCFGDSIRVGGYASCGWYRYADDPDCIGHAAGNDWKDLFIPYAHAFLQYISSEEHKSPLDFFSWHSYSTVDEIVKQEDYCRRMLEKYGYGDTEDILNEWNPYHDLDNRATPAAAANALAIMLAMQRKPVGVMCYYDARIATSSYGGLFNPDTWAPYLTYYAFMSFNRAYKLGNEVETSSDDDKVFVLGATNEKKRVLLIANISDKPVEAEFDLTGADLSDHEILMIDSVYHYTPTGKQITDGKLTLPANSCVEIRL